jgi:bacterioferritin
MQGDAKVIQWLQAQLKNELSAVNQYFVHYRLFKHWASAAWRRRNTRSRSRDEACRRADGTHPHARGLPNLQDLGKLMIGETCRGAGLRPEDGAGAQATIKEGIAHCESVRDYVSREVLQHILDDTEEHIDFLETQLELVGKVGEPNYLQSQMDSPT